MRNRSILSLLTVVTIANVASPAFALPDPARAPKEPLTSLYKAAETDPRLKNVQFWVDADPKSKTVYVSPATRKAQGGVYQAALMPQCDKLAQMYDMTYLAPNVPKEQYAQFARTNGPFSPYFDWTFGGIIRGATTLEQIANRSVAQAALIEANRLLFEEFTRTSGIYERAQEQKTAVEGRIRSFEARISELATKLSYTMDPEARALILADIQAVQAERTEAMPGLQQEMAAAAQAVDMAFPPYNEARARWKPYDVNLQQLAADAQSYSAILQSALALYKQGFEASEATLHAFENAKAGSASAAYTIFDQEVAATNAALNANGNPTGYHAVPLPLRSITLAQAPSSGAVVIDGKEDNSPVPPQQAGTIPGPPVNEIKDVGSMVVPAETGLKDGDGTPVSSELNGSLLLERIAGPNDGAGVVNATVSRGAFCSGSSEAPKVSIDVTYNLPDGIPRVIEVKRPVYTARTSNVLGQAIAINYQYFVQAQPSKVDCTMQVDKFVDFVQSQSDKHILFWGKKTDTATRTQRATSGITCNVLVQPNTGDPAKDAEAIRKIEADYQQEMAAEFLALFGKSWDTQAITAADALLPKERKPGQALSDGIGECGWWIFKDKKCTAAKASLKSLDELFGWRDGSKTIKDHLGATIKRNYNERTYRRDNGSAAIDLVVQVNP